MSISWQNSNSNAFFYIYFTMYLFINGEGLKKYIAYLPHTLGIFFRKLYVYVYTLKQTNSREFSRPC